MNKSKKFDFSAWRETRDTLSRRLAVLNLVKVMIPAITEKPVDASDQDIGELYEKAAFANNNLARSLDADADRVSAAVTHAQQTGSFANLLRDFKNGHLNLGDVIAVIGELQPDLFIEYKVTQPVAPTQLAARLGSAVRAAHIQPPTPVVA